MDENTKRKLVDKNEKTNELYVQEVRKVVSEEYHEADEIAILRKAVSYLFELIATLHAGDINNAEFAKYNAEIEAIKSGIKSNLGMK